VNNVSLSVEKGARHALIGPNGAGKTTVINLLTGVLSPSAGRILLEGQDITALEASKRVRRGLARTFQINQLFLDLTPIETIGLAISERMGSGAQWWRLTGTSAAAIEEIVEILERFHLTDVMYERTGNLPYGKSSRSRWLSPANRACCCSTSPRPGCRRRSGTRFSHPSRRCPPTSPCC
jgi:branched-chain amino acid transport system ATP-binding protein